MTDPSPRRREPADYALGDPTTDPYHLQMLLFGGTSKDDRRPFVGLAQQVQERITHLYRVPKPAGERTGSMIGGGRSGGGLGDDTDIISLRDDLVEWLGDRVLTTKQTAEGDMHGLVARANSRAGRLLKRHHVPERDRIRVHRLCITYLAWLGRSCDHRRAGEGSARECPDCGSLLIEEAR